MRSASKRGARESAAYETSVLTTAILGNEVGNEKGRSFEAAFKGLANG